MKGQFIIERETQLTSLGRYIRERLKAGRVRVGVAMAESQRTLEQNSTFHMLCGDIAKSGAKWMGKARSEEQWKVLLISGHAIATGEQAEIIGGLEGELVNIRESSAKMGVKRGASLIEYTMAWAAQHDVKVRHPNDLKTRQMLAHYAVSDER